MPLTGTDAVLSAALRTALIADPRTGARDDTLLPTNEKALTAFCDVVAAVVLAHIVANGAGAVITTCGAGAGTGAIT